MTRYLLVLLVFTLNVCAGVFTTSQNDISFRRLLRAYDEDRFLDKLTGLVKARISKIDDYITSTKLEKYKSRVNKLELGGYYGIESATAISLQLKQLNDFVKKFNRKQNLENKISLIATLSATHGDDAVAKTLVTLELNAGRLKPELAEVVKQLRRNQLAFWLENEKSVDDVFNLLKLKKDYPDDYWLPNDQNLRVLEDYIAWFNHHKSADETLLDVFMRAYGGEDNMVLLLEKANHAKTKYNLVEPKADELQAALLARWRKEDVPLDSLWLRIISGNNVDEALSNGKLAMFSKYISKYYPENEKSVLERLIEQFGDVLVAKALVTAKHNEVTKDFATKLQVQHLESWIASNKTPRDVVDLLNIKEDGAFFLESSKLDVLDDFIKLFNSNKSPEHSTNIFKVLVDSFGLDGDFARMVEQARSNPNLRGGKYKKVAKYQLEVFKYWEELKIKPESLYWIILNVHENIASPLEKSLVLRYTSYYQRPSEYARIIEVV